ncbi:ankyrin repeat domain-containing protein [Yangia mangrovi]|uniref:Ankyrin repeat domain-containing protein n=1 Tax=Alloyangia mangrovi TaxID=1779329 RepID=A0ABT2KT56_9RHOB|nr:ankyrin repeat domain-containing protein [Alloyangia mangrovi]MCT4373283.1 ankyrin repeat domain-containing protein [Alloyangia mangrovi]
MVAQLVEAGADVKLASREGVTPVMAAAFDGDARMLAILLEAGGDPKAEDRRGKGALTYAAGRAFAGIVAALLEAGAEADRVWGHDLTALMWAAGHANDAPAPDGVETARLLLEAGARIDRQDDRGRSALRSPPSAATRRWWPSCWTRAPTPGCATCRASGPPTLPPGARSPPCSGPDPG